MKRGGRERKLLPCRDSRFLSLSLFFFQHLPITPIIAIFFFFHIQSTGKWSSTSFLCKLFRRLFTRQVNWTNSVVFFTLSFVKRTRRLFACFEYSLSCDNLLFFFFFLYIYLETACVQGNVSAEIHELEKF